MKTRAIFLGALLLIAASGSLRAHCEIPCGIYDDAMRIAMIREHITTIEKSMRLVEEIASHDEVDYNQLVRWINNKEQHANELQQIVTQYFMTQRLKPAGMGGDEDSREIRKLALLHSLLVSAMKAKQSLDRGHIEKMRETVDRFEELYFKDEE